MARLILVSLFLGSMCSLGCNSGTRIKSVEPDFGNVAGNDDVVIVGNGFKAGMVVQFGKREARNIIIDSPSRIMLKTPAGVEGKVDITIIRDDGKTYVLRDGFAYRRDAPAGK